ncbi:FABP family protein [Candidatus Poriferisocius sp.]|uniref:FABP family protein n=1 Tax=Candidatus Poriferisocius sp. TaxID=3101276 RepID=UPI003B01A8A3
MAELHPACAPLAFLLGTWQGTGTGVYPTIEDFSYAEEVSFAHVGKPFVAYAQKTKDSGTGLPLHAEAGYLRPQGDGRIELVLVQPSGIAEVLEGTVEDCDIRLASTAVLGTPSAKPVTATERRFWVDGEVLRSSVAMAAMGLELQHHVVSEMYRLS